jgi:hypothetical protein
MYQTNSPKSLHRVADILYVILIASSFYLLLLSRTGEAQTIWQTLNPAFMPTLFFTTFVLILILFSSQRTSHKLLYVIAYSILVHSLFSIIFPAGDLSGQQMVLGQTRRVFENTVLHGLSGWPNRSIEIFIEEAFRGTNLQAALSTVFARMLSIDILYVHLSLVPVLWGVFVPIGSFLLAKAIGGSEKAAALASLLISAFPFSTYFGAISVPNSLGFIFFLFSLYFIVKYLSSQDSKTRYLMLIFSFFSFLAHFLTGFMSFSFLLLAVAFKTYKTEKEEAKATWSSKALVVVTFLVCLALLPMAFVYLSFIGPTTYGTFTLDKLYELPLDKLVGLFFIGELIYGFDLQTIILMIAGPTLAFLFMIYLLLKSRRNPHATLRPEILFLILAFLIVFIDYRILKLFMEGLPLNEERLWVFRDMIAAPFVALAISTLFSKLEALKVVKPVTGIALSSKIASRSNRLRALSFALVATILVSAVVAGWVTFSLEAAYPQMAPLQTTSYELEAVRYLKDSTSGTYVVIGDIWTIYAGEVIVGINNPSAYYFGEYSKLGHDLFANMTENPSPEWMLSAMNYTDTNVAYFIITEPRLGTQEFNTILSKALQNSLQIYGPSEGFGNGKLYIFKQEKP